MRWRAAWPLPVLFIGTVLLIAGMVTAIAARPKADPAIHLAEAHQKIAAGDYEDAIDLLNGRVLPMIKDGLARGDQEAAFHRLRAEAVSQAQTAAGVDRQDMCRAVSDDFAAAERNGAVLDPADVSKLAGALISLGQTEKAAQRARSLPQDQSAIRIRILKSIVLRNLALRHTPAEETLGLLAEISREPDAAPADAAWVLAREAELLLATGQPADAAARLLRDVQRIDGLSARDQAELLYLLGKAYEGAGQPTEAERSLARAASMTDALDPLRAEVDLILGRLLRAAGKFDEAKERFAAVIADHAESDASTAALLGIASADAALGNDDAALRTYAEVIERLARASTSPGHLHDRLLREVPGLTPGEITDELIGRHADRVRAGKLADALRYAVLAESLWQADRVPAPILLAIAATNRRMGDELMGRPADGQDVPRAPASKITPVDAATREEAKRAYLAAADYYGRHARAVQVEDAADSSVSRWKSADSYDLAGDLEETIRAFSGFLQAAGDDDQRRPEAKFRLAQAFEASHEFGAASALYRELIGARADPRTLSNAAVWADRSAVPMARCLSTTGMLPMTARRRTCCCKS
jgi:tetratricopeptide (TPR) repeat protein